MTKIGFIIVLYHTPKKEVDRVRREIKQLGVKNHKVYFVDNSATKKGYAAGVNEGLRTAIKAGCDTFLVLNPDISFNSITSKNLREVWERFEIGGYAMNQDGKIYYGGGLDPLRLSANLNIEKPADRFFPCEYVTGSLMLIKKSVIDAIGFFDESYGMYYEDVDFCRRARIAEFQVGVDSFHQYTHFEWSRENPDKKNYLKKNRIKYFLKYSSMKQKIYELIRLPKTLLKSSTFLVNFFSFNISSVLIKGLNFILFLFLIRYLSVLEYGIYSLVWAYVSLFDPLADLGTTSYGIIYLPNKKSIHLDHLFSLRLALSCLIFFLTLSLAPIFGYTNQILLYIFLLSPVIFANMASGTLLIAYSLKEKLYKYSAISLSFSILLVVILLGLLVLSRKILFVFSGIGALYLLYGSITLFLLKKELGRLKFFFNKTQWLRIIRQSSAFVVISFFSALYFTVDVFLINFYKGPKAVGIYSAGYKFFEAFLFVVTAYNLTATPALAKLYKENLKNFQAKIKKDALFLSAVGVAISCIVFFAAPYILPYVLKGSYASSIVVSQVVIFALPPILISSVFLNSLYILKRVYLVMGLFILQFIINASLNMLLIPHFSYTAASYITVFSEATNAAMAFLLFRWAVKNIRP